MQTSHTCESKDTSPCPEGLRTETKAKIFDSETISDRFVPGDFHPLLQNSEMGGLDLLSSSRLLLPAGTGLGASWGALESRSLAPETDAICNLNHSTGPLSISPGS